ncbi:hypothetical protein PhaeoP83_00066 [Phaeobacter inhibens]|uniref:Transposase n=1 Tax=Phaeobacter inhibens TaxID=221822 RepID=A0ABM6R9A7_9RHOB|nr:hypothetical protein PhaeoP83_00066 [Phaeobacter inhibens]AUQ55840.1 hypothetical protein PhaeoP92_03205 [Phaeobacter inhibens]AUQ60028.1 hypothetical protein PhaeoP30_03152 [Phaeobacter inhibens]AUQ79856.1 hypothetical protein PhaeoP74_03206 [Phaeobacter inhibens]AUQ92890.1 hypothetical protein PhaeoP66_00059 [Phaeobacter inhibens]
MSRVLCLKYRIAAPACFGSIASHAFGNKAKPSGVSGLRRKLEPPPGRQAEWFADVDHDQSDSTFLQCVFCAGEAVGLMLYVYDQQLRGVCKLPQTQRINMFQTMALTYPQ